MKWYWVLASWWLIAKQVRPKIYYLPLYYLCHLWHSQKRLRHWLFSFSIGYKVAFIFFMVNLSLTKKFLTSLDIKRGRRRVLTLWKWSLHRCYFFFALGNNMRRRSFCSAWPSQTKQNDRRHKLLPKENKKLQIKALSVVIDNSTLVPHFSSI